MANPGFERAGSARLAVGTILNHTFQIRRFVARGGMGEVYEGVNLTTDEHVAIKVISPHLAEDQQVEALFRREARVLPRLVHPALAQYRLMTREPQLGLLYIATEFVDGPSLEAVLGALQLSDGELLAFLGRLAGGLRAAHDLGAIHRDLSPDNILLAGGRPAGAKIIDFGIARDLASTKSSIIGDGFAGKLAFAAPEQFGDFDRQIGAWTDIYSLGLVMLAVVRGEVVDMGSTALEAIERRRAGPDLTGLSPRLRPVLAGMLTGDPARRMRSMDEVLAAISSPADANVATVIRPPAAMHPSRGGRAGVSADVGFSATPAATSSADQPSATVVARRDDLADAPEPGLPRLLDARPLQRRPLWQTLLFAGAALVLFIVGAMIMLAQQPS